MPDADLACAKEAPMTAQADNETERSTRGRVHPRMEETVIKGRHVWVKRDAAGSIVGVSESRQALADTDDYYAVIVRHRTPAGAGLPESSSPLKLVK
jgi:hypothetical protein